jgi:ATP-dependent Zn protease
MGTFRKWWRAKFLPWWRKYRQILLLTAMLIGFMIYLPLSTPDQHQPPTVPITTLQSDIAAQRVKQVTISNEHNDATVELKDGHKYLFAYPTDYGDDLMIRLEGAHIPAKVVGKGFFER